jgi:tRNA pseudouridine38-40 synthase
MALGLAQYASSLSAFLKPPPSVVLSRALTNTPVLSSALFFARAATEPNFKAVLPPWQNETSVRYCFDCSYDGTRFYGWQTQENERNQRTVQGMLEQTLSRRFNMTGIRVVGSGRTDAGVHARSQMAHFDLPGPPIDSKNLQQILFQLNRMLSCNDLRVFNLSLAPNYLEQDKKKRWHATYSSKGKKYSYRFSMRAERDPVRRVDRADFRHLKFDVKRLEEVMKLFEGTHDFRAFSGKLEQKAKKIGGEVNTMRTIYEASLHKEMHDDEYRIDIRLSGALYKMIRNIVGSAILVSLDVMKEEELIQMLSTTSNNTREENVAEPAPAEGLTLEEVYYDMK